MTHRPIHSSLILDALENSIDSMDPELDIEIAGERTIGENHTVHMMNIGINGDLYLVVVKRVGG